MNYEKIKKVAKICHLVGAALLLLVGISEFFRVDVFRGDFFLNIYFILFAGLIVLVEFDFKIAFEYFYFMKFSFGKSLFAGFIALLCFGSSYWIRILVGVFFCVACIGFLIMGASFGKNEKDEAESQSNPSTVSSTSKPEDAPKASDPKLPAPQV